MAIKVGDCVKVKKGIFDFDNPSVCIENWQGQIIEEYDSTEDGLMGVIQWDSQTLREMPKDYIKQSIEDDLDYSKYNFAISDLEGAKSRGKEEDTDKIVRELEALYPQSLFVKKEKHSKGYNEQEQRIVKILEGIDINEVTELEGWAKYLHIQLQFPFKAEIIDLERSIRGFNEGDAVTVKKIIGTDNSYGVIVEIKKGLMKCKLPLGNIEVCAKNSKNYTDVDDFNFWFENKEDYGQNLDLELIDHFVDGTMKTSRKLSEIIIEMIDPYHNDDKKHIESLVSIAVLAWNMTIVPQEEAKRMNADIINTLHGDTEQIIQMEELIVNLMMFKTEQCVNDNRFIVNYHLDTSDKLPHLTVLSIPYSDFHVSSSKHGEKVKAGRNDPCPCGSGKKYKKCCG